MVPASGSGMGPGANGSRGISSRSAAAIGRIAPSLASRAMARTPGSGEVRRSVNERGHTRLAPTGRGGETGGGGASVSSSGPPAGAPPPHPPPQHPPAGDAADAADAADPADPADAAADGDAGRGCSAAGPGGGGDAGVEPERSLGCPVRSVI
ncbi:hypothetical protein SCA03_51920 [Streptomyces cacaoi]|uniref:Uncharacterized protein n=1 Tax=Streptomyces cacaoi TaxID=1898 RepID=A0A4Y3R4M7_STRCI|nr:hypothetical protein SCA03_51920 [Streptomyces cacaoi]